MKIYQSITGCTGVLSADINESHGSSAATASVTCRTSTLSIGDAISFDIGYTDDHAVIFSGFVKQIERQVPENTYTITAQDAMVRALDYFIAPDNPDEAFVRTNISSEALVGEVLALAGITNYSYQTTYYTLAVNGTEAKVSLIGCYDYCKSIADLIAWNLWADRDGTIQFRNRKPYVMTGDSQQPGDIADTSILTLTVATMEDIVHRVSEEDLRNRVVVWGGGEGSNYTASAVSPYLPAGFYKSILFSNAIIGNTEMAQKTADYNLALYNRLTTRASITALGDTTLQARTVITVVEATTGINQDAYVYGCQHRIDSSGYICSLELRL